MKVICVNKNPTGDKFGELSLKPDPEMASESAVIVPLLCCIVFEFVTFLAGKSTNLPPEPANINNQKCKFDLCWYQPAISNNLSIIARIISILLDWSI
ncbi:hypothetical protein DAPPUDRAFT_235910 [Daphnia pulex]|uniref:Uncharacterized protein n=1 Tax=Daphnia pulex TaxID=6669 RepID=E9FZD6_DAPPU|nr:hypothetical protein DAPPUDRAFT_235910 [Daphnia pulex]|eukprot:EFX87033.1 hypothetical protein DAPPUDRAFT_235910 [Daphnia pulex]